MKRSIEDAVKGLLSNAVMEAIKLVRAEERETGRYIPFPEAVKEVTKAANEVLKSYGSAK